MVEVGQNRKEKEDPLDRIMKLTSIGVGVAGIASKSGGEKPLNVVEHEPDDSILSIRKPSAVSDTPNMGGAMDRRLSKLKTSYA